REESEYVADIRLGQRLECAARPQLAEQRDAKQESHSDRGEMTVRGPVRALVEAVGVDQRECDRKQAGALVMVDDDHVERGRAGFLERVEGLRPAIDADRDAPAPRLQFDQRLPRPAT